MSAGALVYALLTGTLLAFAAEALDGLARSRRWPTRWIWAASMVAVLAVILIAMRLGGTAVPGGIVASGAVGKSPLIAVAPSVGSLLRGAHALAETAIVAGVAALARLFPVWVSGALRALWIAGVVASLMTLAFVHLRLRRARRSWPAAELHGRRVRVAPTTGPAVVGLVRPEIVVPHWLLARDANEQRLVLAHEDEHVRAGDHLLLGGACLAVALVPWHPATWWILARLRLAIELDCDARVLRRGVHARSYGEMLIDLAGQCSGFRVGATALADKTTHLERRLIAMRPTPRRHSLVRAGLLCAAAALSLAAACEARVPTSAEVQSMDVASAERLGAKTGLMAAMHGGAAPDFYVNGARVSATEAHAIAPNDIATVNVEKMDSATTIIRITTVAVAADGSRYRTGKPDVEASAPGSALHGKGMSSSRAFDGVILIDGVRADPAALHRLDPKDIAGVEVVKGPAATQMMTDPAAKNGIIKVTLKRP